MSAVARARRCERVRGHLGHTPASGLKCARAQSRACATATRATRARPDLRMARRALTGRAT
eukprot:4608670-Alexandrium_andersonii.AAC.1